MKLKGMILIIYIILSTCTSFAQILSITGSVRESQTKSPLAGVTVAVLSKKSGRILTGTTSDEKGSFQIKNSIAEKELKIRFSFIGYETRDIDTFALKGGQVELGTVMLKVSSIMTSAVEIKGQRPMVEFFVDKQVINMEKVPGSTSGTVSDALKNTGIVEVDPSTNKISIRGNSNVKIMIDGKPQTLADDLLAEMPAAYVDKIEVVTTPSAKDDPESEGGLLNIITKKNTWDNYNASLSLSSSTGKLSFASATVNYKKNNLNIFGSGNVYFGQIGRSMESSRRNYYSSTLSYENSEGEAIKKGYMSSFKLGADYNYDSLNSFSLTGNLNRTNGKLAITSKNWNFNSNHIQTYTYNINDEGKGNFNDYSIMSNYKRKFNSKGHELSTDIFFAGTINSLNEVLTTDYDYKPLYPELQNNDADIDSRTLILNSDYINPTERYGKFEAGYKFTFRDRTSSLDNLNYDYTAHTYSDLLQLSNIFKYKESIHAFYLSYTNKIYAVDYKAGLRMEQTFTDGRQITTNEGFKGNYYSLFPSIGLSYKLNEIFQISFNAARKISRPQMEMINPFVKVNGPNNITVGNPKLKPTYLNSYELRFNPFVNVYYVTTAGRPSQISTNIEDSVTVNTTINSASTRNFGVELTLPVVNDPRFPVKLPDWFGMFNLRVSYNRFMEVGGYLSEVYSIKRNSWRFSGNLSLNLWEDISTMLYFNYVPKTEDERYHSGSTGILGLQLSKAFMDKKLQISLNFNDIFDSVHPVNETYGSNFYSYNRTNLMYNQNISLSVRFNFNDFTNREEKSVDDGRDKGEGLLK